MNVLFVCTGNVCRSPMAEGFLVHEAARRGLELSVRSSGTHAFPGRAATIDARRVMQELGVSIDHIRTSPLEVGTIRWADLVLCLAREHEREVLALVPDAAPKTWLLKSFVRVLSDLTEEDRQGFWLEEAASTRTPASPEDDVDDPIGEREAAYRRVAAEIRDLIGALADGIERARAATLHPPA